MKKLSILLVMIFILSSFSPIHAEIDDLGYIRVETGEAHVVALKSNGTVWTWGSNMYGALGDGTERSRYVPTQVVGVNDVADIAAGRGFTVALKSDGTVWGWGSNWANQLGFDQNIIGQTNSALQLDGLYNIIAISVYDIEFYALDNEGNVYLNCENIGMTDFPYKKTRFSDEYKVFATGRENMSLGIKQDGSVWYNNAEIPEFWGARDVAVFRGVSGANNAYVVLKNGEIAVIGNNCYGQLGNGFVSHTNIPQKIEGISDVKDVSALYNIYVLHNDGTVSTMYNRNSESRLKKIPVDNVKKITQTISSAVVLKNDGTVWTWPISYDSPDPEPPEPVMIEELSDIINISATQRRILAFDKNGKVYIDGFGGNEYSVLHTDGEYATIFNALSGVENVKDGYAEYNRLTLLTTDNKILSKYEYSINGGSFDSVLEHKLRELKEINIGGAAKKLEVMLPSLEFPIVLKENGKICIVSSTGGIDEYTDIPNLPLISDISANFYSLLALDTNGNVRQLGADSGNLGSEDNSEYDLPYLVPGLSDIKTVAAGNDYYFAITNGGELYAWGENGNNQLFQSNYYSNYMAWQTVKSSVINMTIGNPVMLVNNYAVTIPAVPVIVDSRTFVPVREVVENLGGTVEWEDPGRITIKKNDDILVLNIGSVETQYNGNYEAIDAAPVLIDEKAFLPLRYVCEKLGADVLWEETAQRITITK